MKSNSTTSSINALFVENGGVYYGQPSVVPWSEEEDAFSCSNKLPAICHPPCKRWGRYAKGGPSAKKRYYIGDDGGCFAFSLWYVRTFGGVIEHPYGSHAWKWFGLKPPVHGHGAIASDKYGGHSISVDQGLYGHKTRKRTWLYYYKIPAFKIKNTEYIGTQVVDHGFRTAIAAKNARAHPDYVPVKRLTKSELMDTPIEFRDFLINITKDGAWQNEEQLDA